ncbi:MAG: hypothetical protein GX896_01775 [Clostridiales bacterium]|nr:hypothetical protein [Clostridiales bacterium]
MTKRISDNKGTEKNKKSLINYIFIAVIAVLILYTVVSMVNQQAKIAESKEELAQVKDKIAVAQQENDEFARLLSAEDEKIYMERIAIERMGYGYPNEKRYYAMSGN